MSSRISVPRPTHEPVKGYRGGSAERVSLKATLGCMAGQPIEIPAFIKNRRVFSNGGASVWAPHDHRRKLATVHQADADDVRQAIEAALDAKPDWAGLPFSARAAVFLRAAEHLSGPWRDQMNAATMLGQSKTVHQSEIDAACELCDFFRFNVHYASHLLEAPQSAPGIWNRLEPRPLDGFVFAVSPFNFTSIAANLPTAPALMGNTVLWKPAPTQMLSAEVTMRLLLEAGLPPGVINMVPGDPKTVAEPILASPELGGIHFTGSTRTFQHLWATVGSHIAQYKQYPRIVGETGGKDFIFAHPSADQASLVTAIIRGGFEYQGQKCSAASRVYVPKSMWPGISESLLAEIPSIGVGDVADFSNFMGAVIDETAFGHITTTLSRAQQDPGVDILCGGHWDPSNGWFIEPTVTTVQDPQHPLMLEEIFGPVVTIFVYEDTNLEETLRVCDQSTRYGLTGAVFAQDRRAIEKMSAALKGAAGNFYINDKPTGAVVGQQPFGGSRASGTNDKAGSPLNLLRWVSPRTIKENFCPPTDYRYPFMEEP